MKSQGEKQASLLMKVLFRDKDAIDNQLPFIKADFKKVFYDIIVHYDLSEEEDIYDNTCISIRIELFRYVKVNDSKAYSTMMQDAGDILKKYNVSEWSFKR